MKINRLGRPEKDIKATVYVAVSVFDKPLCQDCPLEPYEKVVQAGAALTDKRILGEILTDNVGENISDRNRQFCELTVLYWIWRSIQGKIL